MRHSAKIHTAGITLGTVLAALLIAAGITLALDTVVALKIVYTSLKFCDLSPNPPTCCHELAESASRPGIVKI